MSNYIYSGNRLTYSEYIQAKEFVKDVTSSTRDAANRLSMNISRQTRDVIASNESLVRENIRATEVAASQITNAMQQGFGELSGVMSDGFSQISYEMQEVSAGIQELNATFHWGFGQMLASMGRMNDSLQDLLKIAKTPAQTAAYEQYEIARDAYRQGLYQECLESLDRAISGDHTATGHKLEWRFHQMKGTVYLGFVGCENELIDLVKAEESFLLAARYAKADYPEHAGQAYLSAGWAAYCQGKMKEALTHTEQAILINPNLGEALFQSAKIYMALDEVETALPVLAKAIDKDRFYALKAAGDGDFQRHDDKLHVFLEAMRKEKYRQEMPRVRVAMDKFRLWLENAPDAKNNADICKVTDFLDYGESWPLIDMLYVVQTLPKVLNEIEQSAKKATFIRQTNGSSASISYEETRQQEETFQEEVIIKPGGLFRKAITEMQTKTKMVMKRVSQNRTVQGIQIDLVDGVGTTKVTFDFCQIPSGCFAMGNKEFGPIHQVTVTRDYFLGKYPVTQVQWQAVMGNNPSWLIRHDHPVEQVSWEDCQEFVNRLNVVGKGAFRLPTEAEWEYACRAGSTGKYCFGDSELQLGEYAWYSANSGNQSQPVGKKKPNAWGLYDMHGNVWEWCQDRYSNYSSSSVTDPIINSVSELYIARGGGWYAEEYRTLSAYRGSFTPSIRDRGLGLRLVYVPIR